MWVKLLGIQNIRGFTGQRTSIEFSKGINLLVGPNNSGKSTIIKSIGSIQYSLLNNDDVTKGKLTGEISLELYENEGKIHLKKEAGKLVQPLPPSQLNVTRKIGIQDGDWKIIRGEFNNESILPIERQEPDNFIYPFFAKRRANGYYKEITADIARNVGEDLSSLYIKISRVSTYKHSAHKDFIRHCNEILGVDISSTFAEKERGVSAGIIISDNEHIPITAMGDGVPHLLGFILDLCVAKDKLFLIEEPENDIHPKALKSLLEIIRQKSDENQFIISTHSNIVTRQLGSLDTTKIFKVSSKFDQTLNFPVSKAEEVPNTKEARRELLEELGYEFDDLDLWEAWIIFEERSIEGIVREFLIPKFVPELQGRVRPYSPDGVSKVKSRFETLNNLFVFLHLEPVYKNKVWVIIDSGGDEEKIISDLKEKYVKGNGWNKNRFRQLREHDFEKYYPKRFQNKVTGVLKIDDKNKKREEKKKLLLEVKDWIDKNPEESIQEFQESAHEIIELLKEIKVEIK